LERLETHTVAGPVAGQALGRAARPMQLSRPWFLLGLFFTTAATLCLEILDTRLFSVISWYHLSFFAVSTAMFGMSAGALRVYLGGADYEGPKALEALRRIALQFACVTPIAHALTLVIPIQGETGTVVVTAMVFLTIAVAAPFYLSGVLVTIALTRIPGKIGLVYAVDLLGAALGTLLVIPLLQESNITSAFLFCSALAAAAAFAFAMASGAGGRVKVIGLVLLLLGGAWLNQVAEDPLRVWYHKGNYPDKPFKQYWNIHSQVLVARIPNRAPPFWGPGIGAERFSVRGVPMMIDGAAATKMSAWDGKNESLEWTEYDVTSLPYHLRKGGQVAVVGVGGGRDVLAALRAGSTRVDGIEINRVFIDLLEGERRDFAGIADRPEVVFVHDEARSYLTRTPLRYDVLQMSLIDTWASTGAGAMTLTENGLYTLEAWRIFLDVLKPEGLFSVSRWFDPEIVSETSRLLALCTAALLERGVADPSLHMAVVLREQLATLLVSPSPLSPGDITALRDFSQRMGFEVLFAPGQPSTDEQVRAIVASRSEAELTLATAHPRFDYSPPTDERPFFFNLLKPGQSLEPGELRLSKGVVGGNLIATGTLRLLFGISAFLVLTVIFGPLIRSGLPRMRVSSFMLSVWYFAAIGLGFMFVQIPSMQRFSIYLGHPTYAVVVILFSMILATGIGSLISDRLPIERSPRLLLIVPLAIAALIGTLTLVAQPVIDQTIRFGLFARCGIVIGLITPVAMGLGMCFPIGMRLVSRLSEPALPWMWGVNGACGVFAAVSAVAISMWWGIHANYTLALTLYASLALVAPVLLRRGSPGSAG
jgi:hypothetical protein